MILPSLANFPSIFEVSSGVLTRIACCPCQDTRWISICFFMIRTKFGMLSFKFPSGFKSEVSSGVLTRIACCPCKDTRWIWFDETYLIAIQFGLVGFGDRFLWVSVWLGEFWFGRVFCLCIYYDCFFFSSSMLVGIFFSIHSLPCLVSEVVWCLIRFGWWKK